MYLRFRYPPRSTVLRFFSSRQALVREALRQRAFFLIDSAVQKHISLPRSAPKLVLRGGEAVKCFSTLEKVLSAMASSGMERGTPLVVIGGGALCDLGSLAASLYRRGCPLILVPTTLLAAVDAGLGGKAAVDIRRDGKLLKNLAGAFYPADALWISEGWWESLSRRERLSGAGELLKMAHLAGDPVDRGAVGRFLETGDGGEALTRMLRRALKAKIRAVENDPLDTKRLRESLNYGHTVGHALESLAKGKLSHGECVILGMYVESAFLGNADIRFLDRLAGEASLVRLPRLRLSEKDFAELFQSDKKMKMGKLEMSVLAAPGRLKRLKADPAELAAFSFRVFQAFARP